MVFRAKIAALMAFSVFATSAFVASSASANWFVNGTELGTGSKQALATTALVDVPAKLKIHTPTGPVEVECKGENLLGVSPEIIGKNEGSATSLTFDDCATISPATGCALEPALQNITTEPIKAVVTKSSGITDLVTFTPKTKTTFVKVSFNEGNTCALNAVEPVTGAVTVNAPTGQEERTLQAIEGLGSVNNNSLQVAGDKALIEGGKALLKLASGSKWSFH